MLRQLTLCLLLCLCTLAKRLKQDESHIDLINQECTYSAPVVEATVSIIEAECIFRDNKLFVRRLAYVESEDGENPNPCSGWGNDTYHGGIWQVDQDMYEATIAAAGGSILSTYVAGIQNAFGIVWTQTTWINMTVPLYSALGAMLYYTLDCGDDPELPPRNLERDDNGEDGQGEFWVKHYRPGQDPQHFVDLSNELEENCNKSKSDIVFVLDGSGSVSNAEFQDSLIFATLVIEDFEVGADANQFAVISFGSSVVTNIYLDSFQDKQLLIDAIKNIPKPGGNTATDEALEVMRTQVFSEQHGARGNTVPKVGILVTDGYSNNPSRTASEATLCHDDGITMFAAGVGTGVNQNELESIASPPECTNIFNIGDYSEMQHLPDVIEKRTCNAPIAMGPGDSFEPRIPPDEPVSCTLSVPPEGVTMKINCTSEIVTYYIAYATYPSEAYYDEKVEIRPGFPGYLYVENTLGGSEDQTVFCSIVNNGENTTICDGGPGPGKTPCADIECTNGACVEEDGTWRCTDPCNDRGSCQCLCGDGFTGQYCETEITGEETYNCADNSPCTQENRDNGDFYFPHDDPSMYVQCGNNGECYEMPCPDGLVWDSEANTCNYPPTQASIQQITTADDQSYDCDHHNPCTVQNHLSRVFFHRHHNPFKFIQCSAHGDCFAASCPEGSKWNYITKNCNH